MQVAGPGALSRRTDLTDRDPQYGEGVTLDNLKKSAPLASGAPAPTGAPPDVASALAGMGVVGLGEGSQLPGQPVTAGAAMGAGAGVEALGLPQDPQAEVTADARALGPALQSMVVAASRSDATPSFRRMVRKVIANL
jgi:hypothetical protein